MFIACCSSVVAARLVARGWLMLLALALCTPSLAYNKDRMQAFCKQSASKPVWTVSAALKQTRKSLQWLVKPGDTNATGLADWPAARLCAASTNPKLLKLIKLADKADLLEKQGQGAQAAATRAQAAQGLTDFLAGLEPPKGSGGAPDWLRDAKAAIDLKGRLGLPDTEEAEQQSIAQATTDQFMAWAPDQLGRLLAQLDASCQQGIFDVKLAREVLQLAEQMDEINTENSEIQGDPSAFDPHFELDAARQVQQSLQNLLRKNATDSACPPSRLSAIKINRVIEAILEAQEIAADRAHLSAANAAQQQAATRTISYTIAQPFFENFIRGAAAQFLKAQDWNAALHYITEDILVSPALVKEVRAKKVTQPQCSRFGWSGTIKVRERFHAKGQCVSQNAAPLQDGRLQANNRLEFMGELNETITLTGKTPGVASAHLTLSEHIDLHVDETDHGTCPCGPMNSKTCPTKRSRKLENGQYNITADATPPVTYSMLIAKDAKTATFRIESENVKATLSVDNGNYIIKEFPNSCAANTSSENQTLNYNGIYHPDLGWFVTTCTISLTSSPPNEMHGSCIAIAPNVSLDGSSWTYPPSIPLWGTIGSCGDPNNGIDFSPFEFEVGIDLKRIPIR